MLNKNNQMVKTFSSIDLALFLISAIAVTSIIGTVIPQKESLQFYVQRYGAKLATIFELLDITSMYSSYWFQGLLVLFCVSLVTCTWVRLPGVMAIIGKDSLESAPRNITADPGAIVFTSKQQMSSLQQQAVGTALSSFSFRSQSGVDGKHLFLHEQGAWTRAGAYIVHLSILLIIAGALVGKYFGYDGFVMVPEGSSESSVHQQGKGHATIPLGFELFCQNFKTEYYPNGSPKEYRSDLVVLESGGEALSKSITVNDPLRYKGISFFQSSYRPIDNEYKLLVTRRGNSASDGAGSRGTFFLNPNSQLRSAELEMAFLLLTTSNDGHGHGPYTIQFADKDNPPVTMVVNDDEVVTIKGSDSIYTISLAQRFATGLKVVKDPGVWIVYLGCALMMLGLYVSFFMSHIRVWVCLEAVGSGMKVSVIGKTNKNMTKLERVQEKIANTLLAEESLTLRRT